MTPTGLARTRRRAAAVTSLAAVTALAALAAPPAAAAPAHNVCVPRAVGVPTRPGPPRWLAWPGSAQPVDPALDDPRWLGATGQAFALGGARAPLSARALWATEGGQSYLYLSFIVDLEGLTGAGATTPRDLFVGFRRPAPYNAGTPGDPSDDERAYVFQFHLRDGNTPGGVVTPTHCAQYASCDEASGTAQNFWRVFVDRNQPGTCAGTGASGRRFDRLVAPGGGAPIPWMTTATPDQDAVRFWKLDASVAPLLQHRWAVQLRLPIAPGPGLPLSAGIEPGSTFWYQGAAQITGPGGGPYASLGWWPRELTEAVCPTTAIADFLVHPQLGDAGAGCAGCSPDNYSRLTTYAGARPADCDGGITIEAANVGAVFDAAPGANLAAASPTTSFKATRPDGTPAANTVIAQPVNLTGSPITAPLIARFRLAQWGSAPFTAGDTGRWRDMRGAEAGVCGAGAPPGCAPYTVPPLVDADGDGLPDPGTTNRGAIAFRWTIGTDPAIGASEYCKFGLTPPGGACEPCSCAGAATCDAAADPGTRATVGGAASPCVSRSYEHQCMLVELAALNGGVTFARQSVWNNMNFDQMSVVAREALIDARQLPVGPGQTLHDIYLVAMARNMPRALPASARDGGAFVRERALARAEQLARPYLEDLARRPAEPLAPAAALRGTPELPGRYAERYRRVARALHAMPAADQRRVAPLLAAVASKLPAAALTEELVRAVGPVDAADVLPTLEIYPFYQHLGAGSRYMPMTAFTVFLSHEGAMEGMAWAIDGAAQVGQNVYRLQLPVNAARRIRVRAQAIEGNDVLLAPPDPKWPCAGCCAPRNCGVVSQVGNALPGLVVGIYVALCARRRRRPRLPS